MEAFQFRTMNYTFLNQHKIELKIKDNLFKSSKIVLFDFIFIICDINLYNIIN